MVIEFVGMKEFRQNISTFTKRAQKKKMRYIVLNKNRPVLDVRPLSSRSLSLERLASDIAQAREDVKRGRVYTLEQVRKDLGL